MTGFTSPGSPSARVCSKCKEAIGKESYVCTKENMTLHARCFVCSLCGCTLSARNYGLDLNGKFYCRTHMKSGRPSDIDYKTLASGWLYKQGAVVKKWRRRYFVLPVDSCYLRYYKDKGTPQQQKKGIIDLSTVSTIQPAYLFVPADKNHPEYPNGSLPALQLITHQRIWNLACETDSIREYWIDAIRTAQTTSGSASAAASSGVGRGSKGASSRGCGASPSPPPISCQFPSVASPKPALVQPKLTPLTSKVKTSVPVPAGVLPPPGSFPPSESDDAETSSPDDDCTTAVQETRARTGSGLGRGDGSAGACQSISPTTVSNVEGGGARRMITVQPIVVPQPTIFSNGSTPTIPNSGFMAPGSPSRKQTSNMSSANGAGSPLPWQPSTPRGLTGCGIMGNNFGDNGWDSSSTSSNNSREYGFMLDCRLRAASAGASIIPQMGAPNISGTTTVYTSTKPQVNANSKLIIAKNRMANQDSLLCSPHNKPVSDSPSKTATATSSSPASPPTDDDCGLSSFVFMSTVS